LRDASFFGTVDDIIISPDKAVSYAIVGVGGFLGVATFSFLSLKTGRPSTCRFALQPVATSRNSAAAAPKTVDPQPELVQDRASSKPGLRQSEYSHVS
jgi:hypothetical protein